MMKTSDIGLNGRHVKSGLLAAFLALVVASMAAAAESEPTLEQLLTQAMDNNPRIAAARAKVTLAEAELRDVRFEVARRLVACRNEIKDQERAIVAAEEANRRTPDAVAKSVQIDLKAKLARSQNELQFLTGQTPPSLSVASASSSTTAQHQATLQIPRGPMVEKIRKALKAPTTMEAVETPIQDIAAYVADYCGIAVQIDNEVLDGKVPFTIDVGKRDNITLGAVLQLWDDKFQGVKWVVRDYGLLVTSPDRALEKGYMPAVEFARLEADGAPFIGGKGPKLTEPNDATTKGHEQSSPKRAR
ncbi:MAG: hypothetical protein ABFC77_04560 [Thermoguttaceae bacterium]